MDNPRFENKLQLHKYSIIGVQQSAVCTFEFTGAARGFMIICCADGVAKMVEQHFDSLHVSIFRC